MTYGPIDILAVGFVGNKFDGSILASLFDLVEKELIRIIDLVVVVKDADGVVVTMEMRELDPQLMVVLDPLHATVTGLVTAGDIDLVAEGLPPDSSAAVLLYENLWAVKTMEALVDAGAFLLMQERIPHDVVVEALADIAELSAQSS